jgi:hypothetical protein
MLTYLRWSLRIPPWRDEAISSACPELVEGMTGHGEPFDTVRPEP